MISSSYGWTDDQILDLTPRRVLMVRDTIVKRLAAEHRRQARISQLATRHVVAAVHGAAGNKKAGAIANAIDFLRDRVRKIARTEDVIARFGPPLIPMDDDVGAADGH